MPSTQLRQTVMTNARRIVVKLGTQLLSDDKGKLDLLFIQQIARQIATLHREGHEVTVVSSGAIGAGCAELDIEKKPRDLARLQAIAAVGQRRLMTHLHDAFAEHQLEVGQVLLTRGDFDDRSRFLNIRNCITQLHALGCVPVLNENDAVAIDELRFGDNDLLAAMTCNALRADALILLTVVDGLLDDSGEVVDLVDDVTHVKTMARSDKTTMGSGGMETKLDAASRVTEAGEIAVIANGRQPNILTRLLAGDRLGTIFMPAGRKLDTRQRWIALTARPTGSVTIDDGAARALTKRGKSLLASGIVEVTGRFQCGEIILVFDRNGKEIARGLINYNDDETRRIMGKRSNQFEKILGRSAYDEVVHRDNMVLKPAANSL